MEALADMLENKAVRGKCAPRRESPNPPPPPPGTQKISEQLKDLKFPKVLQCGVCWAPPQTPVLGKTEALRRRKHLEGHLAMHASVPRRERHQSRCRKPRCGLCPAMSSKKRENSGSSNDPERARLGTSPCHTSISCQVMEAFFVVPHFVAGPH